MHFLVLVLATAGLVACAKAAVNPVPGNLRSAPQTPRFYGERAPDRSFIYLRCIRGDEPGYISHYRHYDDRRYAVWVPESQKAENAAIFKVQTHGDGITWLRGQANGDKTRYFGDRPLHFGKDYVDFQDTHVQIEWDIWLKPNGRLMFDQGGKEVHVDRGTFVDGAEFRRLNLKGDGDPAYFYAEPARAV